jgi:hypothetical protein
MKNYPVVILYLMVSVLGLIGLNDSVRQHRKDNSLQRSVEVATQRNEAQLQAMRGLRQDLNRQKQEYETQASQLRTKLNSTLTISDTLQQEVASHSDENELQAKQVALLSTELAEVRNQIEPLRQEVQETAQRFADALEQERDARQQISEQYDFAFGKQNDLMNIFQQLADAIQARAVAEQQVAEQAAAEAANLARLAAQATQDMTRLAGADAAEGVRVAQSITHGTESERASSSESQQDSVESSDDGAVADPIVPETSNSDA